MIPQTSPKAIINEERDALDQAIARVLESGSYILGPEVEGFERAFAAYIGIDAAVGVANGTDALEIALRAVGVGEGERVAVVSMTAVPTVTAIRRAGAIPVFIDIDPDTCLMDLEDLDRRTFDTPVAAVVAVHLYGSMVQIDRLALWCQSRGLALVEDCAQAHGARLSGRHAGTFGDAAAFSFYPTKNLGAIGDAGVVITNRSAVAERARRLRQYGWNDERVSETEGLNSRLDPMQAAILGVMLPRLDARNARRREIAARYDRAFRDLPFGLQYIASEVEPVYHQYVLRTPERDHLAGYLRENGVATAVHYRTPVHHHPIYAPFANAPLPGTDQTAAQVLSLPMFPGLSDEEVDHVASIVRSFYRKP
ncbi:DegT/DnrJ/EryC1/StrS family aminotransferase [Rhodospirillum sp. A1_3_36]|uniref:DegT/DnrJ/EryC1/StrS family aminotransferase n=1 Tax=Rhodospirillum sp. A1_3_36 TaxID=3391666 RepID=UPI0039A629A8